MNCAHQPSVIAIDGQAGEAVGLAEDEADSAPLALAGPREDSFLSRMADSSRPRPERLVERPVIPSIEPDPDRAAGIVQAPRDGLALARHDVDLGTGRRVALDPLDRGIEDPRMAGEERPGSAGFQDRLGRRRTSDPAFCSGLVEVAYRI